MIAIHILLDTFHTEYLDKRKQQKYESSATKENMKSPNNINAFVPLDTRHNIPRKCVEQFCTTNGRHSGRLDIVPTFIWMSVSGVAERSGEESCEWRLVDLKE